MSIQNVEHIGAEIILVLHDTSLGPISIFFAVSGSVKYAIATSYI